MQTSLRQRPERDQVRRTTHLFPTFLGLRLIPVGLWFLSATIPGLGLFPSTSHKLLLLLAIAAVWWIHRWYRHHYGLVEPEKLSLGRSWAILLGWLVAALALSFGGTVVGLRPLVLMVVLVLLGTSALFALPRSFSPHRSVAGAFAALAAIGGVLLLISTRDPESLGSAGGLFSVSVGALLCVAGVLEHRSLARAFQAPREPSGD